MRTSSRILSALASALALTALIACEGPGGGALAVPANGLASGTSDSALRAPSGSTVGFEKATLWVAYPDQADAFSTTGSPAGVEKTLGPFPWSIAVPSPGIVDVAIAPDGTKWVLENQSAGGGGAGFRLFAVAPGDTQPENTYGDDVDRPFAVGLAGDGIMVGYRGTNGVTTIATYPYAASNAPPIRTFQSATQVIGFAEGNDGHLYVARPNEVDVYDPASNGCCPLKSIVLPKPLSNSGPQEFAVGPDNSIYVVAYPDGLSGSTINVRVYAPGTGTLARKIGPLPTQNSGLSSFPAITVDSKNRLYVATNGSIYRFGPNATGTDALQGVMPDNRPFETPVAMAVGPAL